MKRFLMIFGYSLLILFLVFLYGYVVPLLISSPDTILVIAGIVLLMGGLAAAATWVSNLLFPQFPKNKE